MGACIIKISILGTKYIVEYHSEKDDKTLKDCDGYTDMYSKLIVINNSENGNIKNYDAYRKKVLRHEIIHAVLYESSLAHNSIQIDGSWAMNEEMVDFFAIQGEKIYKTWRETGALN